MDKPPDRVNVWHLCQSTDGDRGRQVPVDQNHVSVPTRLSQEGPAFWSRLISVCHRLLPRLRSRCPPSLAATPAWDETSCWRCRPDHARSHKAIAEARPTAPLTTGVIVRRGRLLGTASDASFRPEREAAPILDPDLARDLPIARHPTGGTAGEQPHRRRRSGAAARAR